MRTKTLLATAALAAAGVASMSAQVFSVNAVGYVNVTIPKGFSMLSNPLNAEKNTVGATLAAAPDGTTVYTFGAAGFSANIKDFGEFGDGNAAFAPGGGVFVLAQAPFTVTFVGEVPQGALSNPLPKGLSIRSSIVPQEGRLDTVLGFPAQDGDTIFQWDNAGGKYKQSDFDFGDWSGPAPTVKVAEAFFVRKNVAGTWTRNFSVNQ
jgi:hypothetical protein